MAARIEAPDETRDAGQGDDPGLGDDAIYEQVHRTIARQELPPGTRLREDELRQIFGVSRARIRNVLTRLAYAGVVTLEPNRGASVARPSRKEARDNFAARRAVEEALVRAAAGRIDATGLARLRSNIAAEQAARASGDAMGEMVLSGEFHTILAGIADNAILERFLSGLITREALVIATYERPGRPSCSHDEHADITEALARGDADAAARLMGDHLANIEHRLDLDEPAERPIDLARLFGRDRTTATAARK